jgi:Protein of unknown function (DUF1592)
MRLALACGLVAASLACNDTPQETREAAVTYLGATAHLARISMALRGVRPSRADLEGVAADPSKLPELVDRYLASPEFGAFVRDVHNEALHLKIQHPNYTPPGYPPLDGKSASEVTGAIFDEPLRLIEDIVVHDQPYTQIVTADYTMANPLVAGVWGLAHSGEDRWERAAPIDDRGAAGILASNGLFLRYRSTAFNYNRGRANAISRGLLCHDFLDGEIHLDTKINLADPKVVSNAVVSNPSCAGCHQTLDPLASYFFGYWAGPLIVYGYPMRFYDPAKAADWAATTGRPPGFFGVAPEGLAGLGQAIADDPRFARCAVLHFASYLLETPAAQLPVPWVASLQREFVERGFSAKQLIKRIVLSPRFAAAAHRDAAAAERLVGYQKVRPQQLGSMIEDLTGYHWGDGPVDYLDDDLQGFRVLAGGIDSFFVTEPVHTMSATSSLVTRRLAFEAAAFVVDHDLNYKRRTLFRDGELLTVKEAPLRRQLAHLHARIFSELVDDDDRSLNDELALFRGVIASGGDEQRAWIVTVAAMLSDLRAVYF